MTADFHTGFETLLGSVTEGRAENIRYRQNELFSLHSALRENASRIVEAIAQDSAGSAANAETEFFLAMDAVRISYEKLDFDKSMIEEYSVKFGKDNSKRRAALGLVAIRPSRHSRFYSVVTPLVAALEAGNCVVVELDHSSLSVDGVLQDILPKALDRDTFFISTDVIGEQYKEQISLLVGQNDSRVSSSASSLQKPPQGRTICILDRTGDVDGAAKIITTTRTSSNCTSPYSPDLVLVNEYIKENFIARCLDFASQADQSFSSKTATSDNLELQKIIKQAEARGEVLTHKQNTEFTIVELKNRSSKLATLKITGPYLLLLPTTGIVDLITSQRASPTFLASYVFASPSASKFIAEQISSHATYINQIPPQILIGPPSPTSQPHALHPRFTSDMFSTPQPQYITPPTPLPTSSKLMELALKPLKPTGQRPGHAIGFFEQGILLGLGSTALVVLPLLGWGAFKAVKFGMRYI